MRKILRRILKQSNEVMREIDLNFFKDLPKCLTMYCLLEMDPAYLKLCCESFFIYMYRKNIYVVVF